MKRFQRGIFLYAGLSCLTLFSMCVARAADPWADIVVSYAEGTGSPATYTVPAAALGTPPLFTDPSGTFGGVATPYNSSFGVG